MDRLIFIGLVAGVVILVLSSILGASDAIITSGIAGLLGLGGLIHGRGMVSGKVP
jgi:hypothetical protein